MIDENIGCKPYKLGDKLILEITVTDENKSFDYLGKCLTNRMDTTELGFTIDSVSFWKDRYIANIPDQLRQEVLNELNKIYSNIENLIMKK